MSGLLSVRGVLGGSVSAPTGALQLRLAEGALGSVRLARASASLALSTEQQLALELDVAPRDMPGGLRAAGSVELLGGMQARDASGTSDEQGDKNGSGGEPVLDLSLSVRDGGMSLLTWLAPGVGWQGGGAAVSLSARGPAAAPELSGAASFSRASLALPWLRHPITGLSGAARLQAGCLTLPGLEARVGQRGALSVRGTLPLSLSAATAYSSESDGSGSAAAPQPSGLELRADNLELRLRGAYSGFLDAALALGGAADAPRLGGMLRLSRGAAYLVAPPSAAGPAVSQLPPSAQEAASRATPAGDGAQAELVRAAFGALRAGRARAALDARASPHAAAATAIPAAAAASASSPGGPAMDQPAAGGRGQLLLSGLELCLGPELRAVFPVVLSVGVSGSLTLDGDPSRPTGLLPSGVLLLDSGLLNLVATQFRLEPGRQHSLTFAPEAGLDPLLDVALSSSELRAAVAGRASAWQEHLVITHLGPGGEPAERATPPGAPGASGAGGPGGAGGAGAGSVGGGLDAADPLGGRALARRFEGRLAEALLSEDGSLALGTLAGNTLGSLLPKIETQGQLGRARWRLVSAPSLPGLLSSADPAAGGSGGSDAGSRLLRSLALGTEVELALGRSLVAALSHNMPTAASDGGEAGTEVRVSLALSRQLRLLVQQRGLRLAPSVLLQFRGGS